MSDVTKTYTIAGKEYKQKKLMLGQIRQLVEFFKGVQITDYSPQGVIEALGSHLTKAIAITLHVPDVSLGKKDLDALVDELEFVIDIETAVTIVTDFLDCNPITLLLEQLVAMMSGKAAEIAEMKQLLSTQSLSSLQAGTSPVTSTSDGGTPSTTQSPTSSTETEKFSSEKQ